MKKSKGFTLIELLIVIAIVAILSAVVLIAVNPGYQMAQSRNARRWAEVNALLSAFSQYQVDHEGAIPAACASTTPVAVTCATADLAPGYIAAIPTDPSAGCNYQVAVTTTTPPYRVTVSSNCAELGATISVTR